jgi:hypothetical protein
MGLVVYDPKSAVSRLRTGKLLAVCFIPSQVMASLVIVSNHTLVNPGMFLWMYGLVEGLR